MYVFIGRRCLLLPVLRPLCGDSHILRLPVVSAAVWRKSLLSTPTSSPTLLSPPSFACEVRNRLLSRLLSQTARGARLASLFPYPSQPYPLSASQSSLPTLTRSRRIQMTTFHRTHRPLAVLQLPAGSESGAPRLFDTPPRTTHSANSRKSLAGLELPRVATNVAFHLLPNIIGPNHRL